MFESAAEHRAALDMETRADDGEHRLRRKGSRRQDDAPCAEERRATERRINKPGLKQLLAHIFER